MKILIGVDGSQASLDAVRTAGRLVDPARDSVAIYFSPMELEKRLFGQSRKVVDGAAAALFEEACDLLIDLQKMQGDSAPATTYWLLARCQRCMGDDNAAASILEEGLFRYPNSPELQAELTLMIKPEL